MIVLPYYIGWICVLFWGFLFRFFSSFLSKINIINGLCEINKEVVRICLWAPLLVMIPFKIIINTLKSQFETPLSQTEKVYSSYSSNKHFSTENLLFSPNKTCIECDLLTGN